MTAPAHDPRLTPARDDLAAAHLKGLVSAPRYVTGRPHTVQATAAPLRRAPNHDANLETELLFGEAFTVYEDKDGWSWGQAAIDGYVGYIPSSTLGTETFAANAVVRTLRTYVYPRPDKKAPPYGWLSIGTPLGVVDRTDRFSELIGGGYVYTAHLAAPHDVETDFVEVAQRFLGAPYLWGGRTSHGLDCSALLQLTLARCGVAAPRDSDMQQQALGSPLNTPDLKRGDLVFWNGHVAIMVDDTHILHANAWHMAVTIDSLAEFAAVANPIDGPITAVRRLNA